MGITAIAVVFIADIVIIKIAAFPWGRSFRSWCLTDHGTENARSRTETIKDALIGRAFEGSLQASEKETDVKGS